MLLFSHEIRDDPQRVKGVFNGEEALSFEKRGQSVNNYQRWGGGGSLLRKKKNKKNPTAELYDSNKGTFKICGLMNIKLYDIFK